MSNNFAAAFSFPFAKPVSEGPARFLEQASRHLQQLSDPVDQRDFIDDSIALMRERVGKGMVSAFDATAVIATLDGWKAEIAARVAA